MPKENTFILFVADHGESLYEHNYLGHTRKLYEQCVHIPLMLIGHGIEPGRSDAPACGIDVGPTLLGMAGLEPWDVMRGVNLRTRTPPMDRPRFLETYGGGVDEGERTTAVTIAREPQHQAVVQQGWKLIIGEDGDQLYHLPDDPGEEHNRVEAEPDRVQALRGKLDAWTQRIPRGGAAAAELSEEDIHALEAAGYL